MKNILFVSLFFLSSYAFSQSIDHSLFTQILKDHNYNGMVDYKKLQIDERLKTYLEYLSNVNPHNLKNNSEKIAYWINVYNAFTLKAIVDNYPIESINDLHTGGRIFGHIFSTTVWDDEFIIINGKEYSLNDVEHKILRKEFKEPRIHFAIVCASISCPKLRYEAYTAENLEDQLQDQAIQFFNDETKNKFDKKNRVAELSKILDWFSEDFGKNEEEVLLFASKFLTKDLQKDIAENIDKWEIDYLSYNWDLNDHKN
ncbi:MAG: DUF547 domain-containing protein [Ignavibacteriales bacterium]|nr:DUF547 domain-containing protein [Ignavibacteriales bacterium]